MELLIKKIVILKNIMQITNQNFKQEVEDFNGVVLIDFFAEWCGPCRTLGPIIEELTKEYEGNNKVKIFKLNIDEEKELAEKFNVMSIPTLILFKNGEKVKEVVGAKSKEELKELIENNI